MTGAPFAVLMKLRVPHAGEQLTPFSASVQFTPLLVPSLVTVGVNCCIAFTATLADVGETATEMGRIRIDARPKATLFVTEVA